MELNINKKTLSQQVYDSLKADILAGRIAPGERLTNASLQERFGVSAIPIRDAVIRLQQDGVIDEISHEGAHVVELGLEEALEINEIAQLLCVSALRLSFERGHAGVVVPALEKAVRMQHTHAADEQYYNYDYDFHIAFLENCGNAQYKKVYRQYSMMLEMISHWAVNSSSNPLSDACEECIAVHERILGAYRKGDIEKAVCYMKLHYDDGAKKLQKCLQNKETI